MEEGIYEGVFEVVDSKENYIVLKEKRNILVYNQFSLKSGDIIEAKIEISKFKEKRYSSDFDRTSYYASKRIYNQGKIISFKSIGHKVSTLSIRQKILEYYQTNLKEKSYAYVKACFFGIVELEEEVQEAYSSLFISHILTISGVHILFLFHIFNFLFQKIFKKEGSVFSIGILFGYIWFIGFPVSAIRAFLFLVLSYFNRFGIVKYTKLDIWSISFLIIILINPYLFYQMSFILSFIISFILIFKDEFNCFRIKFMKSFFVSMLCIFSILPFIIQMNHQFSLLGILLSFIFSFILGKYLLPFIFIILVFPVSTYEYVFIILDRILISLNQIFFVCKVPSLPTIFILIYYFLFIFLLLTLASKQYKIKYFVMFFS
ncbi:MAG: ComEC/Rec2 family competence protein, partial [Anaeroplasmataceae bacterium]|nr:ComEC/Rec2 family competence protein [Anaeroplasmataceae bacterium]